MVKMGSISITNEAYEPNKHHKIITKLGLDTHLTVIEICLVSLGAKANLLA